MHFLVDVFNVSTVEGWLQAGGMFVLFGLLFACGLGLPLPEDIPLLIAGFLAANHQMHLLGACILAWCGIIGGDCVLYHLGRKYGLNITRVPFVGKHVTRERIIKAEQLFERYGIWVVGVGRLFAGIRGAMVIAAGATRFNFIKFIIADGIAALVSGGAFIALGYWLGRKLGTIDEVMKKIAPYKFWVFTGLFVLVVLFILYTLWRKKKHETLAEVAADKVLKVKGENVDPPPK